MARIVSSDYATAAEGFYQAGRLAQAGGEPYDDPKSATNPNNAVAWDQSFKTNASLIGSPYTNSYGAVLYHWYFGWKDMAAGWPNRGWQYSLMRIDRMPPVSSTEGERVTRLQWLCWLYTNAWQGILSSPYPPGDSPEAEKVLTPAEIDWELTQGSADRKGGHAAQQGYREPADAGIPGKGAIAPAPAPAADGSPYAGYDNAAVVRYDARQRQQLADWLSQMGLGRGGRGRALPGLGSYGGGNLGFSGGLNLGGSPGGRRRGRPYFGSGGLTNIWPLFGMDRP